MNNAQIFVGAGLVVVGGIAIVLAVLINDAILACLGSLSTVVGVKLAQEGGL